MSSDTFDKNVAILTDTNSGIMPEDAGALGVHVILMPIIIDGKIYLEGRDITYKQFFEFQEAGSDISTSQPSVGDMKKAFDDLLKDHDEVVFIPMSSGLSGTCQSATILAEEYNGKVQVVNNQRISVTMKQSVLDAKALADKGYDAAKIKEILEREKFNSSIYITVQTLKYLKKGGRITPAAAAIGTLLKIKPVLQIQGDKLDSYAKVRGMAQAKSAMMKAIDNDIHGRFAEAAQRGKIRVHASHTLFDEERDEWLDTVKAAYPEWYSGSEPLSMSISTHIGYGSVAVTATCYIPELED